jgi:hypothetical protein
MSLIYGCQYFYGPASINYDGIKSSSPIEDFTVYELIVTTPVGESGIPIADSSLYPAVCELKEGHNAQKKIFLHRPNEDYIWKYQMDFAFLPGDSMYDKSFKERIEYVKSKFPLDPNKSGVFDTIPLQFKTNVWYEFVGLDLANQGNYYVIFEISNRTIVTLFILSSFLFLSLGVRQER